MAGNMDAADSHDSGDKDSVFMWDETSQLYFHASTGFYHDPNAGWYYSSSDGLYYKFEDGNYVLLGSTQDDAGEARDSKESNQERPVNSVQGSIINQNDKDENDSSLIETEFDKHQQESDESDVCKLEPAECSDRVACEDPVLPTSEWLEETLIDLYLSNYSVPAVVKDAVTSPLDTNRDHNPNLSAKGHGDDYELEEGEWIPDDDSSFSSIKDAMDEDFSMHNSVISQDEVLWLAQYGQVTEPTESILAKLTVVDLWDWSMVIETGKGDKGKVARLVGRPVKKSVKLHPAMPSGGWRLRSAPICEVHLDLVRVKTGQVYRLQTPSSRYLGSLSIYDSSNPTKDWGFAELSLDKEVSNTTTSSGIVVFDDSQAVDKTISAKDSSRLPKESSVSDKRYNFQYRDRATERRILHGGYGVGPGHKNSGGAVDDERFSNDYVHMEEASSEAWNQSFGAGSYAQKILKSMGWKEGEGLGKTTKGLMEPLQAEGNIGSAGLGWPQGKRKH